jgi:bacillolysin
MMLFGLSARTATRVAAAEEVTTEAAVSAANRLVEAAGGQLAIRYSEATGVARFVRAVDGGSIPVTAGNSTDPEGLAYAFFEQYGAMFGVSSPRDQLRVIKITSDEAGTSVRMDQFHGELPVFNARLMVHFNRHGALTAVNGTFVPNIKVSTLGNLDGNSAASVAIDAVQSTVEMTAGTELTSSEPVLGIHKLGLANDEPGRQVLAWQVEVTSVTGTPVREFTFIDAANGAMVESFSAIDNALNRKNYNTNFTSNIGAAVVCRSEGDPPSSNADCNDAYEFAGDIYNMYWKAFGRDGIDGVGGQLISYVNYVDPTYCPNASWNGMFMRYCPGMEKDDVVGHELTHGVTEHTAGLIYAYQPGALNESFSDIFGETMDLLNDEENEAGSRWKIGEGVAGFPNGLRNMADPTIHGDPDSCGNANYWCDAEDNGGVHTNSGVPNKAYALMVDGGTFGGKTVKKIGLNRAIAVQYRVLSQYLTPYSNFTDNYEALVAACGDLVGFNVRNADPERNGGLVAAISTYTCNQVRKAAEAVGMTTPVCTDVEPGPAGPRCTGGATSERIFYEDNDGGTSTLRASIDTSLHPVRFRKVTDFTFTGDTAWRINDPLTTCSSGDYTSDAYLRTPPIDLSGTTQPILRFHHDFSTEGGYDGGIVEIEINGTWTKIEAGDFLANGYNGEIDPNAGTPITNPLSPEAFTGYRSPGEFPKLTYSQSRADLTTYVALDTDKSIRVRFRFAADFCNGTDIGWYIDTVEIYDCVLPGLALVATKD